MAQAHELRRNPAWIRDEVILALDVYFSAGRRQLPASSPEVIRLSELLARLALHAPQVRSSTFRNPNGISMILGNFVGVDPDHPGRGLGRNNRLQLDVWEDFAHDLERLRTTAEAITRVLEGKPVIERGPKTELEEEVFAEGMLLTRLHITRERNKSVVERKKRQALELRGSLACEVCGFDFGRTYGELGKGFAECHHMVPLADLPTRRLTRLLDLAIVCSNCHRMLHRACPLLSIDALRARFRGEATQHPAGV